MADGLLPEHHAQLTDGSGISEDVITERGYRSISGPEGPGQLMQLGFSRVQARNVPGLLMPVWTTDGDNPLTVYRPDHPRQDAQGRFIKYEIPKGVGVRLDCPPRCLRMLADPSMYKATSSPSTVGSCSRVARMLLPVRWTSAKGFTMTSLS